ncbi:MAG: hypothetical protein ACLFWL_03725 [Candidatus Brocadiia bacterium]
MRDGSCKKLLLLLLAVSAFGWAGCSYPKPVRTYEYLDRYDRMTDRYDPRLSLVYLSPDRQITQYDNFIIGNVAVGETSVKNPQKANRYTTLFRTYFAHELNRMETFDELSLNSNAEFPSPTLRMEAMITRFKMGSGTARWFSFFFFFLQSSGATDMQIEGRIYDIHTGQVIMEFLDRRRHLGNTPLGPNPKTLNDHFVMKQTFLETARYLASFIGKAHEGEPLEPTEEKSKKEGQSE